MTLLQLLDQIDECLGRGDTISSLRRKFSHLREEAEAIEARVEVLQARIEELESEFKRQQSTPKTGGLQEVTNNLLKVMFQAGGTLDSFRLQSVLGLSKSMVDYHADLAASAGMLELHAITPDGIIRGLTAKGRAYVAENLME